MNLEVGKLYIRIDGGILFYKPFGGCKVGKNPLLFLGSEQKGEYYEPMFLFENKFVYAKFCVRNLQKIKNGKVFEEIKL